MITPIMLDISPAEILLLGLALYALPWIIAAARNSVHARQIIIWTILTGWCPAAWFILLVIACFSPSADWTSSPRPVQQPLGRHGVRQD